MEKTWNLDYDCPQFLDFKDLPQDENLEEYFVIDHERSKKSIFDVNSSVSTCATASPSVDATHFPVHNGPFIFNAQPKDILKPTTSNTKSRRISAPSKNIYSLRPTPSRVERLKHDEKSPIAKKTRNSTGSLAMPVANLIKRPADVIAPKTAKLNIVPKLTIKKGFINNNAKSVLRATSRFTVTESTDPYTKIDFKAMLRSNTQEGNMAKVQGKVTVTKPFTFTQTRKRKLEEPVEPYISMAERVLKFQKERGTPDIKPSMHSSVCRVATRQGNHGKVREFNNGPKKSGKVSSNSSYRVTKPISPKLRVLTRHREVTMISQKEKETMEAEEMKKFQFKAQPVNTKVFNAMVPLKRKLTLPDFQLPSEKLLVKPEKTIIKERKYKFRARPAPKNILDHVVGVSEKLKIEPTKPKSPPFALKERESKWTVREMKADRAKESNKINKPKIKNTANQHNSIVQQSFDKKPTALAPFSFHQKDLTRFAKRDERIKLELEEAAKIPKFQAHPLPSPTVFGVPEKRIFPATEPVPFDLMIDRRGKVLAEKWQRQVEAEMQNQKEALKFKAQPNEVVYKPSFKPRKPEKPLTEVLNICLNTEIRAQEREEFDEKIKQQQEEMERQRELKEMEKAEEEKVKMTEIRAQLVHKANPIRQFKPVHVKKGLIESTIPQTPDFETDKRLKRIKLSHF